MTTLNRRVRPTKTGGITHEGAVASAITPLQRLIRTVNSCFLWEDGYYENGQSMAQRIRELVPLCQPHQVMNLAINARTKLNLRHVPLLLIRELARTSPPYLDRALAQVIQRPDELSEFLAIYWKDGRCPVSNAVKRGLATAFSKFNTYQLAKYNSDREIKLRDVMFLVHPKPTSPEQVETFRSIAGGTLEPADTWEVALSAGANKKETFERLISEKKLGYLALLRNLRNMETASVNPDLIREALLDRRGAERVLPFRYISALNYGPRYFNELNAAFCASVENLPQLDGETIILVDVSGSMRVQLSCKSDMTRLDAACALAAALPGQKRVYSFSANLVECPAVTGLAGIQQIKTSQPNSSTYLGKAVQYINDNIPHTRIIAITDEQSQDTVPSPVVGKAYMINVAGYANGVGYGPWTHISGFSESIFSFIAAEEATGQ